MDSTDELRIYLRIVLRGYLSCGIRYAGQQFGYTIKVGAYLLSLISRSWRTWLRDLR